MSSLQPLNPTHLDGIFQPCGTCGAEPSPGPMSGKPPHPWTIVCVRCGASEGTTCLCSEYMTHVWRCDDCFIKEFWNDDAERLWNAQPVCSYCKEHAITKYNVLWNVRFNPQHAWDQPWQSLYCQKCGTRSDVGCECNPRGKLEHEMCGYRRISEFENRLHQLAILRPSMAAAVDKALRGQHRALRECKAAMKALGI